MPMTDHCPPSPEALAQHLFDLRTVGVLAASLCSGPRHRRIVDHMTVSDVTGLRVRAPGCPHWRVVRTHPSGRHAAEC